MDSATCRGSDLDRIFIVTNIDKDDSGKISNVAMGDAAFARHEILEVCVCVRARACARARVCARACVWRVRVCVCVVFEGGGVG